MNEINWNPISTLPNIPRGEIIDCWVAAHFEQYNYFVNGEMRIQSTRNCVIKTSWLNASLTDAELEIWSEEGVLPKSSPDDLNYWGNDDGEHANHTGWVDWIGGGEGYYRPLIPDENGYICASDYIGRFKIIAWTPVIKPEFPAGFVF